MDLWFLRHGPASSGLPVLLGHKLRAVQSVPGEVGPGRALAEEGAQSVAQVHTRGERSPPRPAHGDGTLPTPTQPERGEPQPHTAAIQHLHRMSLDAGGSTEE